MTRRLAIATALFGGITWAFAPRLIHAATCTGANPCNACKNCSSCKRCAKEGGTCGVCRRKMTEASAR
jgi:hypothetical protein